jgi:hypothetical protein
VNRGCLTYRCNATPLRRDRQVGVRLRHKPGGKWRGLTRFGQPVWMRWERGEDVRWGESAEGLGCVVTQPARARHFACSLHYSACLPEFTSPPAAPWLGAWVLRPTRSGPIGRGEHRRRRPRPVDGGRALARCGDPCLCGFGCVFGGCCSVHAAPLRGGGRMAEALAALLTVRDCLES